jgi:hypothetical protein
MQMTKEQAANFIKRFDALKTEFDCEIGTYSGMTGAYFSDGAFIELEEKPYVIRLANGPTESSAPSPPAR